jgi:hypothetical protein
MEADGAVITFYSFKGGTGRTMALANAGVELARKASGDVLMVDWDLEAPGLHDFFPEVIGKDEASGSPSRGVLELFEQADDYARERSELSQEEALGFWENIDLEKYIAPTSQAGLHLMPAGCLDRAYGSRVSAVPWRDLFERGPDLFRMFAERLTARYRYVLIDSRTGVTDSSGICTMLLPDRLVVVFNSNRQSLVGGLEQARCATAYRSRSGDGRPLLVFPLVSRVEMSEDELRRKWRFGDATTAGYQPEFERLCEEVYGLPKCDLEQYFDEVQIQHAARYAYGESVAVRDEPSDRLSLSRSYQRFVRALLAPGGPWLFEAAARRADATGAEASDALARVGADVRLHGRRARRAKSLDTAAVGIIAALAIAAIALVAIATASSTLSTYLGPLATLGPTILLVELGRRFFAFDSIYRSHSRAATSLARERALFMANGRPYATAVDPVALLVERSLEINEDAEEAVRNVRPSRGLAPDRNPSDAD